MAVTRSWKVYGRSGHRQRESFCLSKVLNMSDGEDIKIVEVINSDKTGTNEYTIIRITRNTAEECEETLWTQISDGVFESSLIGNVEEIFE